MSIQQWKTRPIFLSSTFRDMHAERDHLRHHVFPRLEEELLKRCHHLEWIDLRQGVESGAASTEEERELLVLKVCLDEIERSRPFLIVMLGDRYGWVPSADRMEAAGDEAGFLGELQGHSVTALEIEFGILKESPEQQRRCLFYFREALPYAEMPPEIRATYSEQFADDALAAGRWSALEELKKRLSEDEELKPRIRTYSAGWDRKKNSVTGLETWGNDVFEDLWRELDQETREFAAKPAATWPEIERDALAEFVEQRSREFTGRAEITRQLLDLAKAPTLSSLANDSTEAETASATVPWAAVVTGQPGAGKSALFAKLVSELERDPGVLLLANAAGTSARSASVDAMLRRWIAELAAFVGVSELLPEQASVEEVDQRFASLVGRASMKQRVVVLIDALNQFEPTPRAQHLAWCPKPWPPNARLLATALPGAAAESLSQWAGVEQIKLPPLTEADAREIGRGVWKRYHCPWSDAVWQALAAKTLPDTVAAVGNPLWTTLACEQLALLDSDDFTRAERQFADERDPQARLTKLRRDLAEKMPPDVEGLYEWLLAQTEKVHGEAWARAFAVAIALSRHGWRERDLRVLVPAVARCLYREASATEITSLQLAALRRSFRAHLAVRGENQQWDFFHLQMRTAVQSLDFADPKTVRQIHNSVADYLEQLPGEDPLRQSEFMIHLIGADDRQRAARHYAGGLSQIELNAATNALVQCILEGESQPDNLAAQWVGSLVDEPSLSDYQRFQLSHRLNGDVVRTLERIGTTSKLSSRIELVRTAATGSDPWLSNFQLGSLYLQRGNADQALDAYCRALEIVEEAFERTPTEDLEHEFFARNLSTTYICIGDVYLHLGILDRALAMFQKGSKICEEFIARADDPVYEAWRALWVITSETSFHGSQWTENLGAAYDRIANTYLRMTLPSEAARYYDRALKVAEELSRGDPTSLSNIHNLSVCHNKIGETHLYRQAFSQAQQSYECALEAAERFQLLDPDSAYATRDVVTSCNNLGRLFCRTNEPGRALPFYHRSHALRERLYRSAPDNSQFARELTVAQFNLAIAYEETGEVDMAERFREACLETLKEMRAAGVYLDEDTRGRLAWLEHRNPEPPLSAGATGSANSRLFLEPRRPVAGSSGSASSKSSFLPRPHPSANPEQAAQINLLYQQELLRWKALPWWRRLTEKKPEPKVRS